MTPEERAKKIIALTGDHKEVYAICAAGHHRLYFESGKHPRPATEIAECYVHSISSAIRDAGAAAKEAIDKLQRERSKYKWALQEMREICNADRDDYGAMLDEIENKVEATLSTAAPQEVK